MHLQRGATSKAKVSGSYLPPVPRDRDVDSGEYVQEYGDSEFIEAIEASQLPSTNQIAEEVGCSYTLAYQRLTKLADEEKIYRVEVGNSFAWKLA